LEKVNVKICFSFFNLKVAFLQKTYTFVQDFEGGNLFMLNFYQRIFINNYLDLHIAIA